MKIAIVGGPHVPIPPVGYGGTEQVIYNLIRGLLEAGHEPIVLAPAESKVNCRLIPIVNKALHFPKSRKDLPAFQKQLDTAKKRTHDEVLKLLPEVDIIHSHDFDLKPFKDFPNLTTLHNKIDLESLPYYQERQDLYYVSISKNQQETFPDLKYAGVVYNGEDPEDFPVITDPDDYVCFLGRFDREKNPHMAIQLAINLGIKIKLAGKIDFLGEGYFEQEVEKYFDNPLVEYLGEITADDKIDLISRAKCNLHPTGFREPFGLTVLEAAYCGTPTLAIGRGSMPELIQEGLTGSLVEDFTEGYHQIEECFSMDRLYIANRSRMVFNYKTMSKQYVRAYKKVIKNFS